MYDVCKQNFIKVTYVYVFLSARCIYIYQLGAKNIEEYDFEIGIDIPKPPIDQMGTWTVKLGNGKRLQISGVVVMSWKILRIDL